MLSGKFQLTFGFSVILAGATALSGLDAQATTTPASDHTPGPAASPASIASSVSAAEPPLYAYPPITPYTSFSARSIEELRHLKTATGAPRLPTPNPWFPIDLYQATITRQQFEQKLHNLYDPFSAFTPYLDINDSRVVIYPTPQ